MPLLPPFRALGVFGALLGLGACQGGSAASLTTNTTAQSDLTANTQGYLTARVNTAACLDVVDASTTSGAAVQIWTCHGDKNQLWKVKDTSVQVYGTLCLNASGSANGSPVTVATCKASDPAQSWTVNGAQLINTASNKCLDVRNGGVANGTRLQIWDCYDGNVNQTWLMPNEKPIDGSSPSTAGQADANTTVTSGATASGVANVDAAVNQPVTFADWGISGGFTAIPLTQLLALHSQLAGDEQAFVAAAAQANPVLPPQLLVAICLQESSGGLDLSGYGGPFQFTDDNAWAAYGPKGGNRNNMSDAAIGAANYIAYLLKQNGNDLNAALRGYNGPVSNGGLPQYPSDIQAWMQGTLVYGSGV